MGKTIDRSNKNKSKRHSRNISHPYDVNRYVDLMRNVELNSTDTATNSNSRSYASSNTAGNSSSSGYKYSFTPAPRKPMSQADYYQYVMNCLNGNGRASSSSDKSKPTRYYNHDHMNSYDPFVEDSSSKDMEINEDEFWGNDNLEEDDDAADSEDEDDDAPFRYASFMKPLTLKEKTAKSKALARKAKSSQGVVDPIDSSEKGKSIVRHYERPISRHSSSNRIVSTTAQEILTTSDVDGLETQSDRQSGQHHSARSSYSVKRDLVVWDVHWDQLMLMNLVSKIRQYQLEPVLQEAISEMSQTLSVDGYMQHFTKVYCLRKKCGMKLPKLAPGQSEPTMTETTASMNLLLPQEGLHLRLKALEKQFKEEKEERESGLKDDINDDGDLEPSQNERNSILNSFSRAEIAAMSSKRCLAHFKKDEKKLDEVTLSSSSRRGPGRPRKLSTGQIWWAAKNSDVPAEANSSSENCVASTIPAGQSNRVAPTIPNTSAAPAVPEAPMARFVATIPPTPVLSAYPSAFSAPAPASTPKKVTRKKSFPVKEWFSDRKKRNTPAGQTVVAQELEDTPLKKFRTNNPSATPKELVQSKETQQNSTPSKTSSAFKIFVKRRQAAKAEKSNSKPAKVTTVSPSYPHAQTMQPPAYQRPFASGPVQLQTSRVDLAHNGTEHVTVQSREPNYPGSTLHNNISEQGLMIQNSTSHSHQNSDHPPKPRDPCEIVLDDKLLRSTVGKLERITGRVPEDQLRDQFERELSLEDSSQATFNAGKRQHVESTDIIRLGDPNFLRGMNASSHETPSVAGGLSKASRKKLNKLPSIDSVISAGEGKAQIESKPPPVPRRSGARPLYTVIPPSARQPQQAKMSNISPAKTFSPSQNGTSPMLTREMKNTPYYPYIPAESTPITTSEEWQQNTSRP